MSQNSVESDRYFYKNKELLVNCVPVLQEIRRSRKMCDVNIKVKDQTISAHRIILAATVPYFYKILCDYREKDFKIGTFKEIIMQEHDPFVVEALINYCYSGELEIREDKIENYIVCANLFELPDIRDACVKFMRLKLNSENVFHFKRIAEIYGFENLITAADKLISENFYEVAISSGFVELKFEEVIKIIERDNLKLYTKQEIYEAAMKWIRHNQEERIVMLPEILKTTRLTSLHPDYLVNVVSKEILIIQSIECRDILDEAKNHQLGLLKSHWTQECRNNSEEKKNMREVLYLICGSNPGSSNIMRNSILMYKHNEWIKVTKLLKEKKYFGGTLFEKKIYVVGGRCEGESLSSVEVFDIVTNEWSEGVNLITVRESSEVSVLNDCIYVCGGSINAKAVSSVECFSKTQNEWQMRAPMNQARRFFNTVSLNGFIYAIGGRCSSVTLNSCERYCPTENKWTYVKSMQISRYSLGVATLNGKIYACGGRDSNEFSSSCEVYDPETDSWEYIAPMKEKKYYLSLVSCNGKLYAIGGFNGNKSLSSVEEYCPEKNEWTFATPLPAPAWDMEAVASAL